MNDIIKKYVDKCDDYHKKEMDKLNKRVTRNKEMYMRKLLMNLFRNSKEINLTCNLGYEDNFKLVSLIPLELHVTIHGAYCKPYFRIIKDLDHLYNFLRSYSY